MQDTAAIRAGEELDTAALADFLQGRLAGARDGIALEQFPGGHSNLTYLLKAGNQEYVLRRGPLGPVPPKAHDMAREFRVLDAVHPFFPPAPKPFVLCDDASIIGAVFFIMERRRGVVLRTSVPPEVSAVAAYPARISQGFLDCLIQLHAIDVERHGLLSLGKPEGFLQRQVHGWFERWQRAKTEESDTMERLMRYLADRLPPAPPPALVHNDFKLDNVMLKTHDPGQVEAVLDWEMSTVGDPLVDLGLVLCYWAEPGVTTEPGWWTPAELIGYYAERTGRDVSRIAYYEVFAYFKLAVVLQQIFYRFHRGQTTDERFRHLDERVRRLIDIAATKI